MANIKGQSFIFMIYTKQSGDSPKNAKPTRYAPDKAPILMGQELWRVGSVRRQAIDGGGGGTFVQTCYDKNQMWKLRWMILA